MRRTPSHLPRPRAGAAVRIRALAAVAVTAMGLVLAACGGAPPASHVRTLTIGAYTTPREVLDQRILPAFARAWLTRTGDTIRFAESYQGSGAQARAIAGGFTADIAFLSLEPDLETIARAKLLRAGADSANPGRVVSRSLVVLAVRPGNPKHIRTWDDLARPGIAVLTPNPATSGGARWNVAALIGAALRGGTSAPAGDTTAAEALLVTVLKNVSIMDKGARESMLTFEQGVGDVAITYENEVFAARHAGVAIDYVIPSATLWIETPAAVVDVYADRHGVHDVADSLVAYLTGADAQRAFADFGYRPIGTDSAATASFPPAPAGAFTIRDLGGWKAVNHAMFDRGALFDRAKDRVGAQ